MSSVDALAAAVAKVRESLRTVAASIAHAHHEGEELAGALAQIGAEGRARATMSVVAAIENQQTAVAGLDEVVEQIQAAVEALRGTATGGGSGTATGPPSTTGPPPGSEPRPSSTTASAQPTAVTQPRFAPDPTRRPRGAPANVKETGGNPTDIDRENEAAKVLAQAGYDIEQNPRKRPNGRAPDYMIDGEWWDCYAPTGSSTRTIHTTIRDKVGKSDADRQADRIILNLDGCGATAEEIRARLERSPIRGLQEIKVVKGGKATQFYPWDTEAEYYGD